MRGSRDPQTDSIHTANIANAIVPRPNRLLPAEPLPSLPEVSQAAKNTRKEQVVHGNPKTRRGIVVSQ